MLIRFKIEGGIAYFPGLSKPIMIDSTMLAAEQATELERLVQDADFFSLPRKVGTRQSGAADYRQYEITVEEEDRHHTVYVIEPIKDPSLDALVAYLRRSLEGGRSRSPSQ